MPMLRAFYSLADASSETGMRKIDLIHLASLSKIKLLTPLPENSNAQLVPLAEDDPVCFTRIEPMNFFEISEEDCRDIELHNTISRNCFFSGYITPFFGKRLSRINNDAPYPQSHVWIAVPKSRKNPEDVSRPCININFENLFITGEDVKFILDAAQANTYKQNADNPLEAEAPQQETRHPDVALANSRTISRTIHGTVEHSQLDKKNKTEKLLELGFKRKTRRDAIDDYIEDAVLETESLDTIKIYSKLKEYANNEQNNLLELKDGTKIMYETNEGGKKSLNIKKLRDRIRDRKV